MTKKDQNLSKHHVVKLETHPSAFVCIPSLFHSFGVLEFIHVSLELFYIFGELPVFA